MKDLKVFSEISGSFTDHSSDAQDYLRDNFELTFGIGDKLYLGLYKPFNAAYLELNSSAGSADLSFRYGSDGAFSSLFVSDQTKGFSRSGFLSWDRSRVTDNWVESDVNGESQFWVEIEFNSSTTVDIQGLNLVFSSDYLMDIKNPFVLDYLAKNDTSFIRYHVAARDEIVQTLRNGGYIKMPGAIQDLFFQPSVNRQNITKWDLLDIEEVREAATFKAIAMVFFNESRNVEDKAYNLYRQYQGKYGESFKLYYLSLDKDDDGKEDSNEKLASNESTVVYE